MIDEAWAAVAARLATITGLGTLTIAWLLTTTINFAFTLTPEAATNYAGLAPQLHQSGSSVRGKARIAKSGHADLRHALYMPAVVAYSRCKVFASFVHRLKIAGKPPKVIIVALMRKLVAIAQAILKSGKPFDPTLHYT